MLICLYDNCLRAERWLLLCRWFAFARALTRGCSKRWHWPKFIVRTTQSAFGFDQLMALNCLLEWLLSLFSAQQTFSFAGVCKKGRKKRVKMAKMRMLCKFKGWIAHKMVSLLLAPSLRAMPLSCRLSKGCFSLWVSIVLSNLKLVKIVLL